MRGKGEVECLEWIWEGCGIILFYKAVPSNLLINQMVLSNRD